MQRIILTSNLFNLDPLTLQNKASYHVFREKVMWINSFVFSGSQWHRWKLRISGWAGFHYIWVQMESASISGNENVRPTDSPKLFVSHNCGFVIDFFLRFRLLFASSPDHRSLLPDDIQVIQPGMEKFRCWIHCTFYSIL